MIAPFLRWLADRIDPPEPVGYEAFNMLTQKERDSLWYILFEEIGDLPTKELVANEICQLTLGDMKDYLKAMED